MKIKTLLTNLTIGLIIFSLSSCKEDEDNGLVIVGQWKLISYTVSPALDGETDIYATELDACQKDNLYEFKNDGSYVITPGVTTCDGETIIDAGNYYISKNNGFSTLNMPITEGYGLMLEIPLPSPYIIKVEGDKLILTATRLGAQGEDSYTFTLTYQKQS
jgi:hypothetical protein